jgi:hypothetical protein
MVAEVLTVLTLPELVLIGAAVEDQTHQVLRVELLLLAALAELVRLELHRAAAAGAQATKT